MHTRTHVRIYKMPNVQLSVHTQHFLLCVYGTFVCMEHTHKIRVYHTCGVTSKRSKLTTLVNFGSLHAQMGHKIYIIYYSLYFDITLLY